MALASDNPIMANVFLPRLWRGVIAVAMLLTCAAVASVVLGAVLPGALPGVDSQGEGVTPRRQVARFDFEERALGNFEDLPMHWYILGRDARSSEAAFMAKPLHDQLVHAVGYPLHTKVSFDKSQAVSSQHSLLLQLNGGNVGAFVEVGTIPATPGSDYLVSAKVRTTDLKWARARLVAYFIDAEGRRIDNSESQSEPIVTAGQWSVASARLAGDFPQAASIGIQLEIVQQAPPADAPLGHNAIAYQDITGSAWWDDVMVTQLPRVGVATQSDVGILRGTASKQRPQLSLAVRDVPGHDLLAEVTVFDWRGKPVAQKREGMASDKPTLKSWTPKLPAYGWYVAELRLFDRPPALQRDATNVKAGEGDLVEVGRAGATFLWLPDESGGQGQTQGQWRQPFIVDASGLDAAHLALLPSLMKQAKLGGSIISCWDQETVALDMPRRQDLLESIVESLVMEQQGQVMLNLWPLPAEMAALQVDAGRGPLPLLLQHAPVWRVYLSPLLMRLGQQAQQWHMGESGSPAAGNLANLMPTLQAIESDFATQAPQPRLVVPWRMEQAPPTSSTAKRSFNLLMPASVQPQEMARLLEPWSRVASAGGLILNLQPRANSSISPESSSMQRADDLALRMLQGWEAGAAGLVLNYPWSLPQDRQTRFDPDIALGVWSGVAQRLAGRRVVGRLPVGQGSQCMILDGPAGGMLALWRESDQTQPGQLDMFLGAGQPLALDLFGNRAEVPLVEARHRISFGQSPVFVENVDARLALFREAFSLEPSFIESVQKPQDLTLLLHNPWPRTISGELTFTHPEGWRIEPQLTTFNLPAGASAKVALRVSFPVAEVAGIKALRARVKLQAERAYAFDVEAPLELGLRDVECKPTLVLERDAGNGKVAALVTQEVTNHGQKAIALYAFAALADHPRQERLIAKLEPGESVIRRFRFEDAGPALATQPLRTGLREASGPAILNLLLTPADAQPPTP